MTRRELPLHGRGTSSNPTNRFVRLAYEPDPDIDPEDRPAPATQFFRDTSRSLITYNDSPDIPFSASINVYRGCEHGCVYCLSGDTFILMGDGTPRRLDEVRVGDEIYGTQRNGWYRRYVKTRVLANWTVTKPAYRIRLENGTCLIAGEDHRFLTERGWKYVKGKEQGDGRRPHLTINNKLMGTGAFSLQPEKTLDYKKGYSHPKCNIEGFAVKTSAKLRVTAIESLGFDLPLFDITTGTRDFIANGVVSHNCYARPYHEYLGFSAGLDFETKIMVKENAPELLREELASPKWKPQWLSLSGVTDPYQPIERKLQLTRRCLQVLAEFRNPAGLVTKNHLVSRDIDILQELARYNAVAVFVSLTTLDNELRQKMEPRASHAQARLAAIAELARAGIPVGVMVAPVIPGLTDHEMPALLDAAAQAGAKHAGFVPLRLPHGLRDLFGEWLELHFPEHKDKVLGRIRDLRGGKLNETEFGQRMRGQGIFADMMQQLFENACRKNGINQERLVLSTEHFRRPDERTLFD